MKLILYYNGILINDNVYITTTVAEGKALHTNIRLLILPTSKIIEKNVFNYRRSWAANVKLFGCISDMK